MEYDTLLQQLIEFLGTFAFAISGIRHAAAKHFDWFGGYVCGILWQSVAEPYVI